MGGGPRGGWGENQPITIFLTPHSALLTSPIFYKSGATYKSSPSTAQTHPKLHGASNKRKNRDKQTKLSGKKQLATYRPSQLNCALAGCSEKHLEEATPTTGESPQQHLPAGSQVPYKDNTKDKPEAKLVTGFFTFMIRLFFSWDKAFCQGFSWGKNYEFQS